MTVSMNSWGPCQVLINACYAIMSMFNSVNQCILRAGVSSYKVMELVLSVNKCLRRCDCHSKLVRGKSHTITINRIHIARSVAIIIMSESIDAINIQHALWPQSTWPWALSWPHLHFMLHRYVSSCHKLAQTECGKSWTISNGLLPSTLTWRCSYLQHLLSNQPHVSLFLDRSKNTAKGNIGRALA